MEKMETVNTKLYVLTGFLGSGKTTALLKLLERLKGSGSGSSRMNSGSWDRWNDPAE